jgi:hypothetical protein
MIDYVVFNGFIETFVEIYNFETAVPIIFFGLLIVFRIRNMDRDILKARMFLDNSIMKRFWFYLSTGMVFLAFNTLFGFMSRLSIMGDMIINHYIVLLTQIIYLTAFSLATYQCYLFLSMQNRNFCKS